MKKKSNHLKGRKVLVSLLVSLQVFAFASISSAAPTEPNDIDMGIAGLNYNRNEVLAIQGDQISSFVPKEGIQSNGKFIVVERDKKSLTTSPVDISIVDSITNRTYPGAIQLANKDFADNQPSLVMAARKPLDISIDLPGLKNENTISVQNPNYGTVSSAIDQLVSTWGEKYSSTHTLPARLQYAESMVYSQNQISSALNVNAKVLNGTLGIDFNAVANGEKKVMVAAYKQIFYTVSAGLPNNPSDLFDDSVTFAELARKGVSNEAPPLMVSNVAYGRTIYVKLETTSKSNDVQTAFKLLLNNPSIQASGQYKDIYENSSFTAVVLGGDAQTHNQVVTKDFNVIQSVIKDNAQFSSKNPAYPISYTSVFLKDNSIAAVHNNTEYIETKTTEYTKGKITLDHSGAYVAQFEVSWDEFSYDADGQEIITHKTWDGNWRDKTAHFSTEIPLPPNAKNIRIFARECTGLAWEWWRTVIDEYNVPLSNNINVSIWGTTLYPKSSITH
ncbi:cholesterol-dependent cytolysin alveolysin [Paenibacillus alvei]|uniref:Thiol-activated cytolysin n=1 Tax=Paenibacillus alvei TaxID=44250 RepID=A0AAP6ZXC8_PAEAL|nr:cholesterol-dependent cytolysin alveolysin [Paenibacillus alvei]MBG9733532.1 alveolysin [Paenibacillus alvei]MBG9742613.1 alveolysin [Paenibacillus alvei]MCY9581577.1 cholesterol-dependent cytolysin alveolysin [Paenibacillus alvei]MCY9585416.1 cholesterol-dependent cytolysin alveolysin [Paenibacillus alvei]NEZ42824.1 cholesterol-dependent cytolysin alveolysin [Paenibacillus alvei]